MRDYTPALVWAGKPKLPTAEHDALRDLHSANLIYTLHDNTKPTFLEQLFDRSQRHPPISMLEVLRDGLLLREHKPDGKDDFLHRFEAFDWNDVDYLEVRPEHVEIKLKSGSERYLLFETAEKERRELAEKWSTYQQVGDIPSKVPLLIPDEKVVASTPQKRGMGKRVGSWIGGIAIFVVVATLMNKGNEHKSDAYPIGKWFADDGTLQDNGQVRHSLIKAYNLGDGKSHSYVAIRCFASGIAPAAYMDMIFGITQPNDYSITKLEYRREAASRVLTTDSYVGDSGRDNRRLAWLKPIEAMSDNEKGSTFGATGLIFLGKWMLTDASKSEMNDDLQGIILRYYQDIFSKSPLLINVTYKYGAPERSKSEKFEFNDLDNQTTDFFKKCYIKSPF